MLLFLISFLYSTKKYRDENQIQVTSIQFKNSKKTLYQDNFTNVDTPIHLIGRKNNQISVKKIEASKYIMIDTATISVDDLIIDDADEIPFKMINGGQIFIQNSLHISSKSNEKVLIPQEIIINGNTIKYSNGNFIINSTSSNLKTLILDKAKLYFDGNSFFAKSISGDSDSLLDLQNASSLTVETIEGSLTILCSNDRKTNLYISKQSSFSNLIISNDTDFFAMNCTIENVVVFPSDENSEIILFNLFDSHLNISSANLSNCFISLSNPQLSSESFDLKNAIFNDYNTLIEDPDIITNNIDYQGNVTFSGKSILLLTGKLKQPSNSETNPLKLLSDETSKFTVSDEIFILINSKEIESTSIQYNLANLMILQTSDKNPHLSNLSSFSLIDFTAGDEDYDIQINNENLTSDSNFYVSTIGKIKTVTLKIDNIADKIEFLSNLTGSGSLSIGINSTVKSSLEFDIINANEIEFSELNNIFEMNYNMLNSIGSVIFSSIGFTINETNDDNTFYLTYTVPNDSQRSPTIKKVSNCDTILIYNVTEFPTFEKVEGQNNHIVELKDCNEIILNSEDAKLIKTIKNSSVNIESANVEFSDTFFFNCNITSSNSLTFVGGEDPNHETCFINILDCSNFSAKNYHSLHIGNIVKQQCECTCIKSHLHISANDNNIKCNINGVDSYIYIDEKNASEYIINGDGNFILKNANEIDDDILGFSGFTGSFFIYNCQCINISSDKVNQLTNLLIMSSEFTIDNSLTINKIAFYNSTVFVDDPDINLKQLTLYNSVLKSSDKMNVTDDELFGTLSIVDLLFNGDIIITNLNLWISNSVNSMIDFYQEYKINQSVFTDSYKKQVHSKITMIPSDETKITFGIVDGNEIVFGNNSEYSLFSFHGNSIMNNETLRFLNFDYFFSSINFTNNKKLIGNIKSAEYPEILFDTNQTNITCPPNQKAIIVNEREQENYTILEVACSSIEDYNNNNNFLSSKNCTYDEYNSLICLTENEDEIEPVSPRVVASNSFFETEDEFNCEIDSIKLVINNLNNVRMNLNIYNNSEVTFYDKQDSSLDQLNLINNSKLSVYRIVIDNTSLVMSSNCALTILDSYDEYYNPPTNKSNTIGYLHLISMNESSMDCDFRFNLSTSSFYSSSCSFRNTEIFILEDEKTESFSKLENTLVLKSSIINITENVDVVSFTNFQYNGKSNSIIYVYGNANFTGTCHINGIINCPNVETKLDFIETDPNENIYLYDLQVNCTLNFSQIEVNDKLHLGGSNSSFGEMTIFIPDNLSVFAEGRIHFYDFNMIDSLTYFSNYTSMIENTFIDEFYGRPEIIFSGYKEHEVNFSITGQSNITVLDPNITFTKSFETFNDSAIILSNFTVFQEGATFNGHHVIEATFDSFETEIDRVLWTDRFFIFNEFSCEGNSLITIQSENITIKDQHNENNTILLDLIQSNLLKIQQMFNLSSFFTNKETKNSEEDDINDTNQTEIVDETEYDWKNVKINSTNYFQVNLFSHHVINFHHNEITFNNTSVELYGGLIKDVSILTAVDSEFNIKDDYIQSQTCNFTDSIFTNYMSSIGCTQLTSQSTQFKGYVDIYYPKVIDLKNATINLDLPNNYPIFNVHNIEIEDEDNNDNDSSEKVSFLSDDSPLNNNDIFDLRINVELNVDIDKSYETAKLFMFDVMPNSVPVVTTTQTKGDRTEYLFNSEIENNKIITFKSLQCGNIGEYNEKDKLCIQCPNGSYSYEDKCIESPEGMYVNTQMKSNRNCPVGFYSDKRGQSKCTECPKNMITMKEGSTSKSDCVCNVGFMFDDSFSTKDDEKCIKCPEGLACNKPNILISNVKILEGYYYYNKDYDIAKSKDEFNITDANLTRHLNSSYIFKCVTSDVCLSQVQSPIRLTQCRSEYTGFLCSKCKKNYFHRSIMSCVKCTKFPTVFLVLGPIIHVGLIWLCFIYDSRYCAFLYFFMLFTQHYSNIYQINIKWPPIFTYVCIIFESINLDFRRFFDCQTNDEMWNQGFIFMIINCAFTATYIVFFIIDFKNYKLPVKSDDKPNETPEPTCCDKLFHNEDEIEKPATRVIQVLTIYYFMTFLTQFRWILGSMASKDGHLIVYPYVMLDSYDYKAHIVVIIVNCVYFFGFLLFFLGIFIYFYFLRPITVMFLMFKYLLFDVKYAFTFLPFIYVAKSILMCFIVVYLNQNWFINLYLICVLILCLLFFLYAWPFYNKYIRYLEVSNILFQMFIVSMGIMAQQIHPSFEIFSIVLMALFSLFFIFVYFYYIIQYKRKLKGIEEKKEDYNNRDPSDVINKKEILIKYRNEFNQFFFYDEKFDLNIIAKWLTSTNNLLRMQMYYSYYHIKNVDKVKDSFVGITDDVDSLLIYYKELFISFYASSDSKGKKEILELLKYSSYVKIDDTFTRSYIKFIYVHILKKEQKYRCSKNDYDEFELYERADRVFSKRGNDRSHNIQPEDIQPENNFQPDNDPSQNNSQPKNNSQSENNFQPDNDPSKNNSQPDNDPSKNNSQPDNDSSENNFQPDNDPSENNSLLELDTQSEHDSSEDGPHIDDDDDSDSTGVEM